MVRFNSFRAKDPVLAAIISMGLVFAAPAITRAQSASGDWEEVGPAGHSAQQQLMSAPPRVAAAPLGQANYRPPVEPPAKASRSNAAVAARDTFYVVQVGDTLPKIALKVYGDPNRWQDLMVFNNIDNGNRIVVGQKLVTVANSNHVAAPAVAAASRVAAAPRVAAPQKRATNQGQVPNAAAQNVRQPVAQSVPADFEVAQSEVEETASSVSADAAEADASYYGQTGGSYTVQRGDTLGKIAKRLLGSSQKWREIARANPKINPNKLIVGNTLVIPGAAPTEFDMSAPGVDARPLSSQPWQSAMAAPGLNQAPPDVSNPSFDPPPLMAPPPQGGYAPYSSAPAAMDGYAPPAAPPVYGGGMTPPPPPVGMPGGMQPPASPYIGGPVPDPSGAPNEPVAIGTRELYREARYRIPDELKPTDFTPYFNNFNGSHGLFAVESAYLPYISTWNFGLHLRYEKYQYLNGAKNIIEGTETVTPINLSWAGKKMFAGVSVPFQSWEVSRSGGIGNSVSLSGLHDPSVKLAYQVWKNFEGDHAVTLHAEGKFPGGNYHQPLVTMTGKSITGVRVGPAEATRGAWVEVGGAYSGRVNEKWANHLNLALANDSEDSISKFILRAGTDYRVNRNFSIVGEINSTSYEMDAGPSDTNVDMVLGFLLFNDSWQGSIGFPMALQKSWGYAHDYGVIFGLNHRWD